MQPVAPNLPLPSHTCQWKSYGVDAAIKFDTHGIPWSDAADQDWRRAHTDLVQRWQLLRDRRPIPAAPFSPPAYPVVPGPTGDAASAIFRKVHSSQRRAPAKHSPARPTPTWVPPPGCPVTPGGTSGAAGRAAAAVLRASLLASSTVPADGLSGFSDGIADGIAVIPAHAGGLCNAGPPRRGKCLPPAGSTIYGAPPGDDFPVGGHQRGGRRAVPTVASPAGWTGDAADAAAQRHVNRGVLRRLGRAWLRWRVAVRFTADRSLG